MSATSDRAPHTIAVTGAKDRWRVLAIAMVGIGATAFPVTILSASLPEVARDLDTSDTVISWVVAAPLLALAVGTPIAGKLGDVHGHRRSYLWGYGLSVVFAALTATAWNAGSLIAFRTLGQATGAATGPAALAIIMQVFPREERSKAIGYWSGVTALSPTIGTVVGGPLVDALGWRIIFVIQAVGSAVALAAAFRLLPETRQRADVSFDLPGAALLGAGVGAVMLAVNRGPAWGWSHHLVIAGFVLGPLLLVAFTAVERRSRSPLLPLEWFGRPEFTYSMLSQLFANMGYFGTLVVTPFLLTRVFGYSTTAVALLIVVRPLAFTVAAAVAGRQAASHGVRRLTIAGMALLVIGNALTGVGGELELMVVVLVALFVAGWGQGYARPGLVTAVANSVDDEDLGTATGTLNMTGQIGSSIGITVLATLLGESSSVDRFMVVYLVGAAISAFALAFAYGIPRRAVSES